LRVGGAEIQRSEEMNLSCHPALIEGKCLLTIWHLGSPGRVRVFPQMDTTSAGILQYLITKESGI
jgi:hypothetical protein